MARLLERLQDGLMDGPMDRHQGDFGFSEIQLLKGEMLGIGSYGSVCKAMCNQLTCAAKIIHPVLCQPPNTHGGIPLEKDHRRPMRRFETECKFLKNIRHPNVIQYLGMCTDPETANPVLLMELMDTSLTQFVETSAQPLTCRLQLTLCLDVARALVFLHLNGIVHRDLSSNNILLTKSKRAKLTDFGMAKLKSLNQGGGFSNTICPGTNVYMPPEAIDKHTNYTEKGDVFSFGVNVIQILTGKFPDPNTRSQTVPIQDPRFPSGEIRVMVSEIERRQNHIRMVEPTHPLLETALECLKDTEENRPSASAICESLTALKDTPQFKGKYKVGPRSTQNSHLEECHNDHQNPDIQQSLQTQKEQQQKEFEKANRTIEVKEREIHKLRRELATIHSSYRQVREQLSTLQRNTNKEKQRKQTEEQLIGKVLHSPSHNGSEEKQEPLSDKPHLQLKCSKDLNAPCKMSRSSDSVVIGSLVYFTLNSTRLIHAYHLSTKTWSQLPVCPTKNATIAVLNGFLTTIGGELGQKVTNVLFGLKGHGSHAEWSEMFPPMPTKRVGAAAQCVDGAMIVAGGVGAIVNRLRTVEVLYTKTLQWATAAHLPEPRSCVSLTVCGDSLYMLGGWDLYSPSNTVLTCSLSSLYKSCQAQTLTTTEEVPTSPSEKVWSRVSALPVHQSTAVSLGGHLLAIAGSNTRTGSTATAAYRHDPVADKWQVVGHLNTPRQLCFASALHEDKLLIVGGRTSSKTSSETDSVEIATLKC